MRNLEDWWHGLSSCRKVIVAISVTMFAIILVVKAIDGMYALSDVTHEYEPQTQWQWRGP